METCVRRLSGCAVPFVGVLMAAVCAVVPSGAEAQGPPPVGPSSVKTFFFKHLTNGNDENEVLVALRNMLDPRVKIYLVESERAVVVSAPEDQMALVQQVIDTLDRPRKLYRLTFTVHETDAGKAMPVRETRVMAVAGERLIVKQGDKVPVVTGSYSQGSAGSEKQFTYIDVGVNLVVTLDDASGKLVLRSKVEDSAVGALQAGAEDPTVQQTVLEGVTELTPGKSQVLGAIDGPGGTRHVEVEVTAEPV